MKDTYIKLKINCEKLEFPMKFICQNQRASITVMIAYNDIPSSAYYDEKHFENKFFIFGGRAPDNVKTLGIMFVSHEILSTRVGVAFKGIKQKYDPFRQKIPFPQFDIPLTNQVLRNGIDYEKMMDVRLNISKAKMSLWEDNPQDIVKKNISELSKLKCGEWSRIKYQKLLDIGIKERRKAEIVKEKKEIQEEEEREKLKKMKSRRERCKEKRIMETTASLAYFLRVAVWRVWIEFFKKIEVFNVLIRVVRTKRRIEGSKKLCDLVSIIFGKVIPRLKRGRKSSGLGCLIRSRL